MSFYEALELLLQSISAIEAIAVAVLVGSLYFACLRRRIASPFDPLAYVAAMSAVSTVMLVLMTRAGAISVSRCAFVIASLTLFYAGFLVAARRPRPARAAVATCLPAPLAPVTLAIIFLLQASLLGTIYALFGIPLFLDSRLEQFVGSGGFGALSRLQLGLEFASLVLAFVALRLSPRHAFWARALIGLFVVSSLLSGSKGAILSALFAWYLARVYSARAWCGVGRLSGRGWAIGVLLVAFPLFVVSVQTAALGGGAVDTLMALATRVAAEGDAYAYFLGNEAMDSLARFDPIAPLRPVLAALRLVPAESVVNPGFAIVVEVLGVETSAAGPNTRLPIYLLLFYGPVGIAAAPLAGAALGAMRNSVVRATRLRPLGFALVAAAYYAVARIEVDPQLAVDGLFALGLALPLFVLARGARLARTIGATQRAPRNTYA